MREGCRRGEPLSEQQNLFDRLALGELLDSTPFVEQARRGPDHIFTDSLEQKVHGFRRAGELRADGHDESARLLNDAPRPPIRVRKAVMQCRLRVKSVPHRFHGFLPGVVVEHEIAQVWMPLETHAEQVLRFPLVPVRGVNPLDHTGEDVVGKGRGYQHTQPAHVAFAVKRIAQMPIARTLLDDQTRKTEPFLLDDFTAHIDQHRAGAGHFGRRSGGVEVASRLSRPAPFDQCREIGGGHGRFILILQRRPVSGVHAAA